VGDELLSVLGGKLLEEYEEAKVSSRTLEQLCFRDRAPNMIS
jgi:hypothetical protein